jgi:hypothetical protein
MESAVGVGLGNRVGADLMPKTFSETCNEDSVIRYAAVLCVFVCEYVLYVCKYKVILSVYD